MQKKIKKNHMHELSHSGAYEWYAYSFVEIFTEFKSSDSALLSRGRTRYPAIQIRLNELNPFHSRGVVVFFFFFPQLYSNALDLNVIQCTLLKLHGVNESVSFACTFT